MNACLVTCTGVDKDAQGNIIALRCTYDEGSLGGMAPDGRRVKGTLHWVSATHALDAEVRLYDHLFSEEFPEDGEEGSDFPGKLNPDSIITRAAKLEPWLADARLEDRFQFMRNGFFFVDPVESKDGRLVFNRIVSLRSSWKPKNQ
jgi:glutaminyl-tRNA synthetase